MPSNPNFPVHNIEFQSDEGLTKEEKLTKTLTFIGASVVSLLCYETGNKAEGILRSDGRFKLARKQNVISAVWPLAQVANSVQPNLDNYQPPLLAWSDRLQTLFLGFRGTDSLIDGLADLNIGQTPEPNLGSRFHAGFFARASQYTGLIEQLAKKFKVVVCGHSLGGAMASIATYLFLGKECDSGPVANVWEQGDRRLSVVTFGSPAPMVVEKPGTTVVLQARWTKNFHQIINPHDWVPFSLGESSQWIEKLLSLTAGSGLPMSVRGVLGAILLWTKGRGRFTHYGCIYLLERTDQDNQVFSCSKVTSVNQIPLTAPEALQVRQYHAMEHYAFCQSNTLLQGYHLQTIESTTSMSSGEFCQHCWPLSDSIGGCVGLIHDNRITIFITVESRLAPFLLNRITFKCDGAEVPVGKVDFSLKPDDHDQISINIQHTMDSDMQLKDPLTVVHAIRELHLQDCFGRSTAVSVTEMRSTSLQHASLPTTFESLRLAMIVAFADQIAKVQALKIKRVGSEEKNLEDAGALTGRAKRITDLVDSIVSNACPHLIAYRLQHAWGLTNEQWPKFQDEQSSLETPEEKKMAGAWPSELLLPNCPPAIQKLISDMLDWLSQKGLCFSSTSVVEWEKQGRWKLSDAVPEVASLAMTLKKFGESFYNRPVDPEQRIEHAIQQADEVLSVIRFCHLIILTQLDAPADWLFEAKMNNRAYAAFAAIPLPALGVLPIDLGIAAVAGVLGVSVIGASIAVFFLVRALLQRPNELLGFSFDETLEMSMQVLGVDSSPLSSVIIETPITEYLKSDMRSAEELKTLRKWQEKLEQGLKKHPDIKGSWTVKPTIYWAKWLFNVARVGQLRDIMASHVRIGVEGPTEGGKSELLTTLTAAAGDVFRSGPDASCRTMEIQSYKPPGLDAVFVDCPGADDKNERIREMARLFREMFGIVIFVIPSDRVRSQPTEEALREIATFLRDRKSDLRPVRVLLSKADQLEFHRNKDEVFRNSLAESKKSVIESLRRLGPLDKDFVIHSRQTRGDASLLTSETLDQIVQPYSTHAQMSLDGKKALSDCPDGEERKIEGPSQFRALYRMAEDGRLWDVESLRQWLRALSPNSVPDSSKGRVKLDQ